MDERRGLLRICRRRHHHDDPREHQAQRKAAHKARGREHGAVEVLGIVAQTVQGENLGRLERQDTGFFHLPDLTEMADDLCYGCVMVEGEDYVDEDWVRKYCEGHA